MIGVATNGLVRYIVADDEGHTSRAAAFLEGAISVDDPGFVSVVVLVELVWVLERTYRFSPDEIIGAIESVLQPIPSRCYTHRRPRPISPPRSSHIDPVTATWRSAMEPPPPCIPP
jgi:predicted nucleic acid-binding protein